MERNWAGNVAFTASRTLAPRTVTEVAEVVAGADAVAVVGTGHAFNRAADGPVQLSVAELDLDAEIDHDVGTVTVPAGWTYARLVRVLAAEDLALANLASLPDISIGGAIASATHGSGARPRPGPELQSEWAVAADRWEDAVRALSAIGPRLTPAINVAEIRWVAADDLWLSPQYGQDTVAVGITWHRDQEDDVQRAIPIVHEALAPFDARPHLAKMTPTTAADMARLYPRHADFVALADRLDPDGVFRNEWARSVIFAG